MEYRENGICFRFWNILTRSMDFIMLYFSIKNGKELCNNFNCIYEIVPKRRTRKLYQKLIALFTICTCSLSITCFNGSVLYLNPEYKSIGIWNSYKKGFSDYKKANSIIFPNTLLYIYIMILKPCVMIFAMMSYSLINEFNEKFLFDFMENCQNGHEIEFIHLTIEKVKKYKLNYLKSFGGSLFAFFCDFFAFAIYLIMAVREADLYPEFVPLSITAYVMEGILFLALVMTLDGYQKREVDIFTEVMNKLKEGQRRWTVREVGLKREVEEVVAIKITALDLVQIDRKLILSFMNAVFSVSVFAFGLIFSKNSYPEMNLIANHSVLNFCKYSFFLIF